MARKKITILGSTGSIGRQALQIIDKFPERFQVTGLSCATNLKLLELQAKKFRPQMVVAASEEDAKNLKKSLPRSIKVFSGPQALEELAAAGKSDTVLMALVGAAGLKPLMSAIDAGRTIALANKEPMVMAGKFITAAAKKKGARIIPVDSEHSAIFQLLQGRAAGEVRRVILSASGGPFLRRSKRELAAVSVEEAVRHPTWRMGRKISVDSATLMNKALELIEARWLFGLDSDRIDVIIHPQSVVHSLVEMSDGSVFAHMSMPDMRIPIGFALFWPERPALDFPRLELTKLKRLDFERPDLEKFPALRLGFKALKAQGTLPAVMNAADEESVSAFLAGRIGFERIVGIVEEVMKEHRNTEPKNLGQVLKADAWARNRAGELTGV